MTQTSRLRIAAIASLMAVLCGAPLSAGESLRKGQAPSEGSTEPTEFRQKRFGVPDSETSPEPREPKASKRSFDGFEGSPEPGEPPTSQRPRLKNQ